MTPELLVLGIVLPAWVIRVLTLIVWIGLIGVVLRMMLVHARERLRCPTRHRMAYLTLLRGYDGALVDVVRCSLIGRGKPFTCDKRCLRSARA
jgi:hypothetical protein